MSALACGHDALEWFAAIGPTAAAAAAAWATWKTSKVAKQVSADGLALQRQIARPVLVIGGRLKRFVGGTGIVWIVEMKNMGQSAANIDRHRILVGANEIGHVPLEPTVEDWGRVIASAAPGVGILSVEGQVIKPPFAVSPGEIVRIFETRLEGDVNRLHAALRTLAIDVEYVAPWGDRFSTRYALEA